MNWGKFFLDRAADQASKGLVDSIADKMDKFFLGETEYNRRKEEQRRIMEERDRKNSEEIRFLLGAVIGIIVIGYLFGSIGFYIAAVLAGIVGMALGYEGAGGLAAFMIFGKLIWHLLFTV